MSKQRKISDIFRPPTSSSGDKQSNKTEETLVPEREKNVSISTNEASTSKTEVE